MVQTLTFRTLYVFVLRDHQRRRIVHWNVTAHPNARWVWRQIIDATPWRTAPSFLIRDRDGNYGCDFVRRARAIGIETVLSPVHAPQANALAERVIGTIRRECLDHLIVLNETRRRGVLGEYVTYYTDYTDSRPHRSPDLEPPLGPRRQAPLSRRARVLGAPVIEGLHHVYDWAA